MEAPKVQRIKITDIVMTTERRRALQSSVIDDIAESIQRIGLRTPITVRMVKGTPHLVTGEHRVRAALKNKMTHIDAVVFDNEHDARIWEIDENLARADLDKQERLDHLAARAVLIAQRTQAAREAPPMPDRKLATRDDARAAGEKFFYPTEQCVNGHDGKRYVSTGDCTECKRLKAERWKAGTTEKVVQNGPLYTGRAGRGQKGGDRAAARELGTSHQTIGRAKLFAKLSERCKQEAIRLGLASNHHALKYVLAHDSAKLQMQALQSAARKVVEKAERKRFQAMTVQEQAAAAPPPRVMPLIDHQAEMTNNYWLWLVEEFGDRAYAIINRLREVNVDLLLKIADKAKADGTIKTDAPPKTSLH